jgi:hypothetical protein
MMASAWISHIWVFVRIEWNEGGGFKIRELVRKCVYDEEKTSCFSLRSHVIR